MSPAHPGHADHHGPASPDAPKTPQPARPPSPFVLRVGLTGGIAAGKSTVAKIFATLGATLMDADDIAHRLIEKDGAGYDPVAQAFGPGVLREDGSIDRARIARIIFADASRRAALEKILHPLIRAEETVQTARLAATGLGRIAVTNAALLIETGYYRDYHRVVVVHCAPEIQTERLVRRDALSEEDAKARIGAQMDTREKLKVAHYTIDTTPGFAATEVRARAVFRHLQLDLQALSDAV